ncbi:hypothetical protein Lgee_0842 [Legionella geestiana]|uniref:Uncharacterized protein n=1 Tax=Legionella geestiana TaxID=45065 RepID=A0A0W0U0Z2_9GAMM|nr:Kdo hydroxylase family protein [Legionella geestiana]KTD01573.1 hypothetical protein Lgee_0842 [Legionella geestiana]QBS11875.1 hypothetical protein E4T54_03435 [Legionella geestiana]STX53423.1 Protein of uncharacterised function (DUF2843) [Legionella geestiana]
MEHSLYTLDADCLRHEDGAKRAAALEAGSVLYFPEYSLSLSSSEKSELLTPDILDGRHKNVSYNSERKRLGGFDRKHMSPEQAARLQAFMQRFADFAHDLVADALPDYLHALRWGRTSFRPARIQGRTSSERKDDTRLHVDAFPATPVNGLRILRVFCNINPENLPRVWHLGEPFAEVLAEFSERIPSYSPLRARMLHLVRATKTRRSAYDHYMLHLHDAMKLDNGYQARVRKQRIEFPAQSTWIVFTDSVSHAALDGQHLLEQTFYLPVEAMVNPEMSPLYQWQALRSEVKGTRVC